MLTAGLLACPPAFSLEESRLWLPIKYHRYYLDLVESAQAAEALDACKEVLRGEIDLEQSKPEHPVFRILCRRPDGLSYNEMVDGLSKKTLTTVIPEVVELTPEQLEEQRLELERQREEQRKQKLAQYWQQCFELFQQKTRLMLNMQLRTEVPPVEDSFEQDKAQFSVDFDATDISNTPLQYRAVCNVNSEQTEVKVMPRR